VYPYTHIIPARKAALDTAMIESSGLVFTDGKLWTHNDGGNPAVICSIDTATGAILQTVHVDNFSNADWEDIAADSGYIYIADVGNNNGDRQDLKILKIAKADIGAASVVHVTAQAINLSYADQTSFSANPLNNYDCEAIVAAGDSLYLFTKNRGDNHTRVYRVSKTPGSYTLSPHTSYNVAGLITGAAYNAQTKEIALIGYTLLRTGSFLLLLNDYAGDAFFSGNKRKVDISNGTTWQTEAVAWMPGNRLCISSEGDATDVAALYHMSRVLPSPAAVAYNAAYPARVLYPNPVRDVLYVSSASASDYRILDEGGCVMRAGKMDKGKTSIAITSLSPGIYTLISGADNRALRFVKQ
jgi:hypothetical protein